MKPERTAIRLDFPAMDWEDVRRGGARGRMRRGVAGDGRTVRILEMSPDWNEEDWCAKEHIGYVLSGRVNLDFADQPSMEVGKGQAFAIPKGCAHKATCGSPTRLFMVG